MFLRVVLPAIAVARLAGIGQPDHHCDARLGHLWGRSLTQELSYEANLDSKTRNFRAFEAYIVATGIYLLLSIAVRQRAELDRTALALWPHAAGRAGQRIVTLWDIFRNLLLAARWTVAAVADRVRGRRTGRGSHFCGSAARRNSAVLRRLSVGYVAVVPGHAIADAVVSRVLLGWRCLASTSRRGLQPASHLTLYTSAYPDRDMAWLRQFDSEGAMGGERTVWRCRFGEKLRHVIGTAGASHRSAADGRLSCAGDQGHRTRIRDRLHRADQGRHDDHERDVSVRSPCMRALR